MWIIWKYLKLSNKNALKFRTIFFIADILGIFSVVELPWLLALICVYSCNLTVTKNLLECCTLHQESHSGVCVYCLPVISFSFPEVTDFLDDLLSCLEILPDVLPGLLAYWFPNVDRLFIYFLKAIYKHFEIWWFF